MKNKIGWCNATWNPVWGCNNHCEYCYARKIAKRFYKKISLLEFKSHFERHPDWVWTGDYLSGLRDFKPTFLYSQYCKRFPKKPQRIFVGSMSEIAHWEKEWMEMVIEKVKQYPQHTFMFLTKFPKVYMKSVDRRWKGDWYFIDNCWLGITISKNIDITKNNNYWPDFFNEGANKRFISFEPLLENINLSFLVDSNIDWVIIGAETGNRKGKVIPKKEWVENIVNYCRYKDIPVYLKDSLKDIYPVEIKEFPNYK